MQPVACTCCQAAGTPCVVNLGRFHGCYNCKARSQGCSLCPQVGDVQLTGPWCWWLTLIHHVCALLELESQEGPIYVLPNYRHVEFPPFEKDVVKFVRQPPKGDRYGAMWKQVQKEAKTWTFYAYPHEKLITRTGARPERDFWPHFANQRETIKRAVGIIERGRAGLLPRPWALGCEDGFSTVRRVTKSSDKKVQAPSKDSAATSKSRKPRKAGKPATATATKQKTSAKAKGKKREHNSPVPSRTEDDEGKSQLSNNGHYFD